MPASYFFATIERFDEDAYAVPRHVDNALGVDDPACEYSRATTYDRILNIAGQEIPAFAYEAHIEKRIRRSGRFQGMHFTYYFEPHNFIFYRIPNLNVVAFATGKDHAKYFVRKLKADRSSQLRLATVDLDLHQVQSRIPVITGAWVGNLGSQFLRTMAVFGNHVNQSNEFQNAVTQGQISAIYFNHTYQGRCIPAGVSRHGAIFISERILNSIGSPDIATELAYMLDIYSHYVSS